MSESEALYAVYKAVKEKFEICKAREEREEWVAARDKEEVRMSESDPLTAYITYKNAQRYFHQLHEVLEKAQITFKEDIAKATLMLNETEIAWMAIKDKMGDQDERDS